MTMPDRADASRAALTRVAAASFEIVAAAIARVEATVSLLEGKWTCVNLYRLAGGTLLFNALRRSIPKMTQRMLINQLRELEADGLVERLVYLQVPPRVDYSLSERGRSIVPVLAAIKEWGDQSRSVFANRWQAQAALA